MAARAAPSSTPPNALVLAWLGQATTALARARLGVNGRAPGPPTPLLSVDPARLAALTLGVNPPAADLPHLPQHTHGPLWLGLGDHGLVQVDALAQTLTVFVQRSRALRRRVCSVRPRASSSGARDRRPWPARAPCSCATAWRCQRPSLGVWLPRWWAASLTPEP